MVSPGLPSIGCSTIPRLPAIMYAMRPSGVHVGWNALPELVSGVGVRDAMSYTHTSSPFGDFTWTTKRLPSGEKRGFMNDPSGLKAPGRTSFVKDTNTTE